MVVNIDNNSKLKSSEWQCIDGFEPTYEAKLLMSWQLFYFNHGRRVL